MLYYLSEQGTFSDGVGVESDVKCSASLQAGQSAQEKAHERADNNDERGNLVAGRWNSIKIVSKSLNSKP